MSVCSYVALVLCAVVPVVAGCGDDAHHEPPVASGPTASYVPVDANKLCTLFTTCPNKIAQTYDACVATYEAARVPDACVPVVAARTCASPSSDLEVCFPKCTDTDKTCDGDHLTECTASGRRFTSQCDDVCETQRKTWSGTCGLTYKNESVEKATCWCN